MPALVEEQDVLANADRLLGRIVCSKIEAKKSLVFLDQAFKVKC